MKRVVRVVLSVVVCSVLALQVFGDRRGDIEVRQPLSERTTVVSPTRFEGPHGMQDFAEGVASAMGLPALHAERKRSGSSSLFERPRAFATVVIDGAAFARQPSSWQAQPFDDSEFSPLDFVSSVSMLFSGADADASGIPAAGWLRRDTGAYEKAYESSETASFVPTLLDVAEVSTEHRSWMVVAANDRAVARALAPRSAVAHRPASNAGALEAGFVVDGSSRFASVYASSSSSSSSSSPGRLLSTLSQTSVAQQAAALASFVVRPLSRVSSVAVTQEGRTLEVVLDNGSRCDFSLGTSAVRGLVAQLAAMQAVARQVGVQSMARDDVPDYFAFGVALDALRAQYGSAIEEGDVHERAAVALAEAAALALYDALEQAYSHRVHFQTVFVVPQGAPARVAERVLASGALKEALSLPQTWPALYLPSDVSPESRIRSCEAVREALPELRVHCRVPSMERAESKAKAVLEAMREYQRAVVSDSAPSGDDVAIFQVIIWCSLILISALALAVYPMFFVHELRDEVLFSIDFDEQKIMGPKLRP